MFGHQTFAALVLICAASLRAGEAPIPPETGKTPSATLLSQARDMLNEIFSNMKSEHRLPPAITDGQFAARVDANVEMLKSIHIFDVTPAQETAFKNGEFNDAANLEQLGALLKYLKDMKADLPAQTVYAMRHFEAKDLKGARLEMCLRAVSYNVSKIREMLGDAESPAKGSKL